MYQVVTFGVKLSGICSHISSRKNQFNAACFIKPRVEVLHLNRNSMIYVMKPINGMITATNSDLLCMMTIKPHSVR